jgi:hypothetical protein
MGRYLHGKLPSCPEYLAHFQYVNNYMPGIKPLPQKRNTYMFYWFTSILWRNLIRHRFALRKIKMSYLLLFYKYTATWNLIKRS